MSNVDPILQFNIVDINILDYQIDESFDISSISDNIFETKIKMGIGAEPENHLIICQFAYQLVHSEKEVLTIENQILFKFNKDSFDSLNKKNKIEIPKGFAEHLSAITVSTSRGILQQKTQNTNFKNFYLPLINVNALIDKDIEIQVN